MDDIVFPTKLSARQKNVNLTFQLDEHELMVVIVVVRCHLEAMLRGAGAREGWEAPGPLAVGGSVGAARSPKGSIRCSMVSLEVLHCVLRYRAAWTPRVKGVAYPQLVISELSEAYSYQLGFKHESKLQFTTFIMS